MADTRSLIRIVNAHQKVTDQVRARVNQFVTRSWDGLSSWRAADAERLIAAITPIIVAGQKQMATLTDAYLAQMALLVTGTGRPMGITVPADLRGVPSSEVYRRPFETVWWRLSEGDDLTQAVALGRQRLETITATDLQLGLTHAARERFDRDRHVVGFRRTLRGGTTCGLCAAASTQRYHKGDLLPIHGRCDCGVAPIYGTEDPGLVIDEDRLAKIADATGSHYGETVRGSDGHLHASGLKRHRGWIDDDGDIHSGPAPEGSKTLPEIAVHQHGELGPVLTEKAHAFRGPADL